MRRKICGLEICIKCNGIIISSNLAQSGTKYFIFKSFPISLHIVGSNDGYVHFWKCGETCRSLDHLFSIPLVCYYNHVHPVRFIFLLCLIYRQDLLMDYHSLSLENSLLLVLVKSIN